MTFPKVIELLVLMEIQEELVMLVQVEIREMAEDKVIVLELEDMKQLMAIPGPLEAMAAKVVLEVLAATAGKAAMAVMARLAW